MNTMRKNEIIRKAMGLTPVAYHNIRHSYFAEWCEKKAIELALPSRMLVMDSALYDWYCDQWMLKVELPFYTDNQDFLEAELNDVESYQELFLGYIDAAGEHWPSPILKRIHKQFKNSFKEA
jgi:hypothetical protein